MDTLTLRQKDIVWYARDNLKKTMLIHGVAGSGKSVVRDVLLKQFPNAVCLGPTGMSIAGIDHPRTMTIARFIGDHTLVSPLPKQIIIDEFGMIGAKEWSLLDNLLQKESQNNSSFGGVRLVLIGDLFQLQPVGYYFFTTFSWKQLCKENDPEIFSLNEIKRITTKDPEERNEFENLLESLRYGTFSTNATAQSLVDYFLSTRNIPSDASIPVICATNDIADTINTERLAEIDADEYLFKSLPLASVDSWSMLLKVGAAVQITRNIYKDNKIIACNGLLCDVSRIKAGNKSTAFFINDKKQQEIHLSSKNLWKIDLVRRDGQGKITLKNTPDKSKGATRFPLRLSWAMTVHKIQGQTLDRAIIIGDRMFEGIPHLYTAFSRVRSLHGLYLKDMNSYKINEIIGKTPPNKVLDDFIHTYNLK